MPDAVRSALMAAVVLAVGCASTGPRRPTAPHPRDLASVDAYAAILRAEDLRVVDEAFRETWSDPNPRVRARAARAIGRLGLVDARTELRTLLSDPEPSVRRASVFALALLEGAGAESRVQGRIADPDPDVRAAVAWFLGRHGAAAGIGRLMADPDPTVRASACLAAWRFPGSREIVDLLLESSASEDSTVVEAAAYALARLGSGHDGEGGPVATSEGDRDTIRKRLVALAGHDGSMVRMQAAAGLSHPAKQAETEALAALLADRDLRVRVNAVRSLAYPGAPVDPYLRRASKDGAGQVIAALLDGLAVVGTANAESLVLDMIGPNWPVWLRVRAIASLGRLDPDRLLSLTPRFLLDDDPRLGAAALRGLAGRRDPKTLELFRRGLVQTAWSIRVAAVQGLAEADLSIEEIRPAVESADPAVRMSVARAVALRLRDGVEVEAGLEVLSRLQERSSADSVPAARLAVVEAAGVAGSREAARDLLRVALADPDRRVRERAAELLRTVLDEDVAGQVAAAAERSLDDYRAIATWSLTSHAAVVTVRREGFPPGRFTLVLDGDRAPISAWNFARLAEEGFYDGLSFFDLVPNAHLRTGDPRGDGLGGPGYSLPGEPSLAPFGPGSIAMAAADGGSNGSQWMLVYAPEPTLVGRLTALGRVVQNFPGVALLVVPDDLTVSVEVYEGDGTEPLPPLK